MANTQIDVAVANFDLNESVATAAGTVTNDVRVVFKQGISRNDAYIALEGILDKLGADGFTLQ